MSAVIYENNPSGDNIVIIPTGGGGGEDKSRFDGLTNDTVNQGADFDPKEGVKAYGKDGKEIDFTVSPEELNKCEIGNQTFTYTAGELTQERIITVQAVDDPTISGLDDLTVEVGEEFDPLEGVSAKDGNGNDVDVEVVEPEPEEEWVTIWSGMYLDADSTYNFTTVYDTNEIKKIRLALNGQAVDELNGNEIYDGAIFNDLKLVVDGGNLTAFVPQDSYDGVPISVDVVLK